MQRVYSTLITHHLAHYSQMVFLSGPRHVGKTTLATLQSPSVYLSWDTLQGHKQFMAEIPTPVPPMITFDELDKLKNWKNSLKGFFDCHKEETKILVAGSTALNRYIPGNDSLMGRYFLYRIHPLSVAELLRTEFPTAPIAPPQRVETDTLEALLRFGGFPESFIKQDALFYQRWQNLRTEQMLKEDIRALSQVIDLDQLALLTLHLQNQTGQLVNYHNLGNKIQVSDQTIRRWITLLESCFYCFTIKPWGKNISNALTKMPKIYLYDWSVIQDPGALLENFVASHLYKAVQFWTDMGFGKYDLYFIRDKAQNEVDFLVTHNNEPWFLVEVKASYKSGISKALFHFKEKLKVPHAFQVAADLPYVEKDCFTLTEPMIVPLTTFLSQLV